MINMSALKPNVSGFPFISFNRSGFSILLNDISSQGVSSKDVYIGSVMIYDTKQYRVLLELHITQGQLESPEKTKRSSVDSYGKKTLSSYCTTTLTQCVPTLKNVPYLLNSSPSQPKIPYADRFSAFWLRLD